MKTIKVIDLLNKIANGEQPQKIKYMGYTFECDTNHKRYESYFDDQIWTLNDFVNINDNLTDEVEIIEEKKIPEKLYGIVNPKEGTERIPNNEQLIFKINEIIDYLDYLKIKGE